MNTGDDDAVRSIQYLRDLLTKVCIQALQSNQIGEWVLLVEVLGRIKPLGEELATIAEVEHYAKRVYQFCQSNHGLQSLDITSALQSTFPTLEFTSIVSVNFNSGIKPSSQHRKSPKLNAGIIIPKEPYLVEDFQNIFKVQHGDLQRRQYESEEVKLTDIQIFLPCVVSELTKLESTWNICLGTTVTALNTDLPQTIHKLNNTNSVTKNVQGLVADEKKPRIPSPSSKICSPKTGREVVEYLVRTEKSAKANLWYLNYVASKEFNPYRLVVATKNTVKERHVVISVFGVLHVEINGTSELTPLFQWYMESTYFNTLHNISFFRNYFLIKAMKQWKVNMRYKKFARVFRRVKNTSLLTLPAFPDTMKLVSHLLDQFSFVSLWPNFGSGRVHLKSISFLMWEQLQLVAKYFTRLFSFSQNAFNKCFVGSANYVNYCRAQLDLDQNTKSKESMSLARKRKETQKQNLVVAQNNLQRLDALVILINQLLFSHVVYLYSQDLHSFICKDILQNENGCFYVFVDISPDCELTLAPKGDAIFQFFTRGLTNILNSVDKMIKKVSLNEAVVINDERLKKKDIDNAYFDTLSHVYEDQQKYSKSDDIEEQGLGENFEFVFTNAVLSHHMVKPALEKLNDEVSLALDEANLMLKAYSWVCEIVEFTLACDRGEMEVWTSLTPSALEKQIVQISTWSKEIECIIGNFISSNGVVFVDCSTICSVLQPQLEHILNNMINDLAAYNLHLAQNLSQDMNQKIAVLSQVPEDIVSFSKYFMFVNELESGFKNTEKQLTDLRGVYDVIKHCCRQLTTEEREKEETVARVWSTYMFSLQTAKEYISAQTPTQVMNMKEEMKEMREKILHTAGHVTSGIFLDATQSASMILKEMKVQHSLFESLLDKLRAYGECQLSITGEQVDLTDIYDAQKKIKSRYQVWRNFDMSVQTINEWKRTLFGKLNVRKVHAKVREWMIACEKLQKDVSRDDKVMKRLIELIKEFSNNINIMKELANPALKTRHWKEVFVVLGHVYDADKEYHVSDIISMPIIDNVYKISQICSAAVSESALQDCLSTLIRHWEKRNFKFAKKISKERKEQSHETEAETEIDKIAPIGYILTGIDELSCELEDNLVTLQSMLGSPHVAEVRDLAGSWNSTLQEVKQILDLWMTAQQEWSYLSNILSRSAMQKQHPAEVCIFIKTNKLFKDLIESIMKDSKVLDILHKRTDITKAHTPEKVSVKEILETIIQQQSIISSRMEVYLSKIRSTFPRLYYLSNDEMLNLLAINRNPPALVPFLRECFPTISDVLFGMPKTENKLSSLDVSLNLHRLEAGGFAGAFNENVHYRTSLPLSNSIILWMKQFEVKMKMTVCENFMDLFREIKDVESLFNVSSLKRLSAAFTFQSIVLYIDIHYDRMARSGLLGNKSFLDLENDLSENIAVLSKCLQDLRTPAQESYINKYVLESSLENETKRFLLLIQVILCKLIHHKDKVSSLALCEQLSVSSFEWMKMIRYRLDPDFIVSPHPDEIPRITLTCLDLSFRYGYEYVGPGATLVMTPLTDRCIFSMLLSLGHHEIGCLTGRTLAGKSESASELSKLLGRHFMSLNCTDMTPLTVIKMFLLGAVTAGSVLAVENINFLKAQKLSLLGQIFTSLTNALQCITSCDSPNPLRRCKSLDFLSDPLGASTDDSDYLGVIHHSAKIQYPDAKVYVAPHIGSILFDGNLINVSPLFGCFVTTDTSFHKWQSIPDNLRMSLRPVAFTNIDKIRLLEVWFMISGFKNHKALSRKLGLLMENHIGDGHFTLHKVRQLISQNRCWEPSRKPSTADEFSDFASSLINMVKPSVSQKLFSSLFQEINNRFTSSRDKVERSHVMDTVLLESVREQIMADNLSPSSKFIEKVLELHQVISSNRSVILVGGVASGKTTCYRTLARALCQFYSPWSQRAHGLSKVNETSFARVNLKVFYPNVLMANQMYGYFDDSKDTAVDGILTKIISNIAVLQDAASNQNNFSEDKLSQIQHWFVMDGFVDESWCMPFYSFLGSSAQFVLGSGKRICLRENMKVLFETDQLVTISPGLVSRSAIIHFQNGCSVNWQDVFKSWKTGAYNKYSITLQSLDLVEMILEYSLERIVKYLRTDCEFAFDNNRDERTGENSVIGAVVECNSILQMFSAVLECWKSRDHSLTSSKGQDCELNEFMSHALAYSMMNGLSPLVDESSLPLLDIYVREIFSTCPVFPLTIPCSIAECYFDGKIGNLVPWDEEKFSLQVTVTSSLIMSKEIQQYYHLADILTTSESGVLLVGEPGSGKSSLVKHFLSLKHDISKLQMSPAMNVECFQNTVRAKSSYWLKKQAQRNKLKTAKNVTLQNMILFLDDLNLAVTNDNCTDQPVIECVRQIICEGGVYDFEGKYFHHLPPIQLIASYTPPETDFVGGCIGNCYVNTRLRRHFALIHIRPQTSQQLKSFFCQQASSLETHPALSASKKDIVEAIVDASVNIHESVRINFPCALNPLYVFSKHDIVAVFRSLSVVSTNTTNKSLVKDFNKDLCNGVDITNREVMDKSISEFIELQQSMIGIKEYLESKTDEIAAVWQGVVKEIYLRRLMLENDRLWFQSLVTEKTRKLMTSLREIARKAVPIEQHTTAESSDHSVELSLDAALRDKPPLFAVFSPGDTLHQDKCITKESFVSLLKTTMKEYNSGSIQRQLDLVLFDEMLRHTESLSKVVHIPGGHALLVSQNGYGRHSIVKLVCKLYGASLFDIDWSAEPSQQKLKIRNACTLAGLKGKSAVIFAPEDPPAEILVYLSALICDGFCPNLYSPAELSAIYQQLLPATHRLKTNSDEHGQVEERFLQRIKQNLHIVVCQRYDNSFNTTLRKYPMLVHKVSCIDTYLEWREDNWFQVAQDFFGKNSLDVIQDTCGIAIDTVEYTEIMSGLASKIHIAATEYVDELSTNASKEICSPRKYLVFLQLFLSICRQHVYDKQEAQKDLQKATDKIVEVEDFILRIKEEIAQLMPLHTEATSNVEAAHQSMIDTEAEYEKTKNICEAQVITIEELRVPYEDLKMETDNDFHKLSPQYERAMESLSCLDHYAIDELRSYLKPPPGVIFVTNMLCEMFKIQPSWEEGKLLLMRDKFIDDLLEYNKDAIEGSIFKKLGVFVKNPLSQSEEVKKASFAAFQLALWMHAIHSYGCILRDLEPKKILLEEARQHVLEAEKDLAEKTAQQMMIQELLEKRVADHANKLIILEELEKRKTSLEGSLKHARDLLLSASVFTSSWSKKVEKGRHMLKSSSANCLLAAAIVTYGNSMCVSDGREMLTKLASIVEAQGNMNTIFASGGQLVDILSNNAEQSTWKKKLDANGKMFIEYAVKIRTLTNFGTTCWSLLVDPHRMTRVLISVIESGKKIMDFSQPSANVDESAQMDVIDFRDSGSIDSADCLVIVDADSPGLQSLLENAMVKGSSVLVQHIERLEDTSYLSYVLDVQDQGGYFKMKPKSDESKKCHQLFKLYLSASVPSIHEEKYRFVRQRTIPFYLNYDEKALQKNMLNKIISAERADLNRNCERNQLDLLYFKREEKEVYTNIFKKVKLLKKTLVEESAIKDLIGFHREKLMLLDEKMFQCSMNVKEIMSEIDLYQPLATFLVDIYYIVQDIQRIHPLYHFSLDSFCLLIQATFEETCLTHGSIVNPSARIKAARSQFLEKLFKRLSVSLFKEHVLLFPFRVVLEELISACNVRREDVILFCNDMKADTTLVNDHIRRPDSIENAAWCRFEILALNVSFFSDLLENISENHIIWDEYFHLEPMVTAPPGYDAATLNIFNLGLLWLAYKPSLKLTICLHLINHYLGPSYTSVPVIDFEEAINISTSESSITTILLPDTDEVLPIDPVYVVKKLADAHGIRYVTIVSMSDGDQLDRAIEAVGFASKHGSWVVLENCHLVTKWTQCFRNSLEKIVNSCSLTQHLKNGRKFHLWMVIRACKSAKLPMCVSRNSYSVAWQHGKTTHGSAISHLALSSVANLNIRSTLSSKDADGSALAVISAQILSGEVYKNEKMEYSGSYNVSLKDFFVSKRLPLISTSTDILKDYIKEVVYLPQMYTVLDRHLLWKFGQSEKIANRILDVPDVSLFLGEKQSSRIPKSFPHIDVRSYDRLAQRIGDVIEHNKRSTTVVLEKTVISDYVSEEVDFVVEQLRIFTSHLLMTKAVVDNRRSPSHLTEKIQNAVSANVFPHIWKENWTCSGIQDRVGDLYSYIDFIEEMLNHFHSVINSSGVVHLPLNLRMFNNPRNLINAIKVHYSLCNEVDVESVVWIGDTVSDDSKSCVEDSAQDSIVVSSLTLVNATLPPSSSLLIEPFSVQLSPNMPCKEFEETHEMISVYSFDKEYVILDVLLPLPSSYRGDHVYLSI